MSCKRSRWMVVAVAAVAILGFVSLSAVVAEKDGHSDKDAHGAHGGHGDAKADHGDAKATCGPKTDKAAGGRKGCQKHAQQKDLAGALKALDAAATAVEKGEKHKALTQLKAARKLIASAQHRLAGKADIVNALCPIMGSKIKLDKLKPSLIREWQDQQVGFCCPGCLAPWDKLSDAEKSKKLHASLPKKHK